MAVQPRDLQVTRPPVPRLELVPAPPRRHPAAAALFAVLLVAALSVPIVDAALEPALEMPAYQPRAVAAVEITKLDRLEPVTGGNTPRSADSIASVAFVRCTRLWAGDPDGSNERRLLDMAGISSPAFSPDGRTIAFIRTDDGSQSLWLAAADGSEARRVDTFRMSGGPVPARVSGLAWSGNGTQIAFALTDGTHGPLEGGSAVWTLDLGSGRMHRIGGGWPAPAWFGDRLLFGGYGDAPDLELTAMAGGRRIEGELNSAEDDLAAAVVPQGWWSNQRNGVAVLRSDDDGLHLALRNVWGRKDRSVYEPPAGYRFARFAQPVITQDASRVAIDLLDPGAGRDLGLLDAVTGKWTILDYAWDPTASPTPTIVGPLSARDARTTTEMLFSNWGRRPGRTEMMTEGHVPPSQLPWKHIGWLVQEPEPVKNGWMVPSIAYSYGLNEPHGYRELDVAVLRDHGRLTATPTNLGPLMTVRTLEEAHGFAELVTGSELPELPALPEGTKLKGDFAINASSWNGVNATINAIVPSRGSRNGGTDMSFSYGSGIDFSLGCGGAVDPQPTEVAEQPAMIDRSGSIRQVIWPATPEEPTGAFSVHGNMSKNELLELAEKVATQ